MVRVAPPVEVELANTKIPLPTSAIVLVPSNVIVNSAAPFLIEYANGRAEDVCATLIFSLYSNPFLIVALCRVRTLFCAS